MLISSPSKVEINNLIKYFNARKYEKAHTLALKITKKFPNHPFGWKALGLKSQLQSLFLMMGMDIPQAF